MDKYKYCNMLIHTNRIIIKVNRVMFTCGEMKFVCNFIGNLCYYRQYFRLYQKAREKKK